MAQTIKITETTAGFNVFHRLVLNNSGRVAFTREGFDGTARTQVISGSGAGLTVIVDFVNPPLSPPPDRFPYFTSVGGLDVNNRGKVVFSAGYAFQSSGQVVATSWGIYSGPNPLTDQIPNLFSGGFVPLPLALNDLGFFAILSGSGALVVDPSMERRFFQSTFAGGAVFNNNNQLAYVRADSRGTNLTIERVNFPLLASEPFLPSAATVIARVGGTTLLGRPVIAMNDSGTVAFYAVSPDGSQGIYSANGGGVATLAQDDGNNVFEFGLGSQGPGVDSQPAINNNGEVAFVAHSKTLGKLGIFKGSNPVTDKVVAIGDELDGSILDRFLYFSKDCFNDAGQVAFIGRLEDGRIGVYVTLGTTTPPSPQPVPEIHWAGPPGTPPGGTPSGEFAATLNWSPEQVPKKDLAHNDAAIFDRSEAYSVNIGLQSTERLLVQGGNVTFTNANYTVAALDPANPSVVINNARLNLGDGADPSLLTSIHALIGGTAPARVDVRKGAQWRTSGRLTIGRDGDGLLRVESGGFVSSGETHLSDGSENGDAFVTGSGARWQTGNMSLGNFGEFAQVLAHGFLTIEDGGLVESGFVQVGSSPEAIGRVVVTGKDSNGVPSTWLVSGPLFIGPQSSGLLRIEAGGEVYVHGSANVGYAGSTGTILVSGADSKLMVDRYLKIGVAGAGEFDPNLMTIQEGGLVTSFLATVGEAAGSRGNVVIESGANWEISLGAQLADAGQAKVDITGSGRMTGGVISLAKAIGSECSVTITGGTGLVAEYLEVGNGGHAVITLQNGGVDVADGDVIVGLDGVIQGIGQLHVGVLNNAGTISPGLSPGVLTIDGNYQQQETGVLKIELGGTDATAYDQLIVRSNATLGGKIIVKAINGFAPKTGDQFNFLQIGGTVTGHFATVELQNLASGFKFAFATNGSTLSLTALNDAIYQPALPGGVEVTITNVGGISFLNYSLTTSNLCVSLARVGPLTRTNNQFNQSFEGRVSGGLDCSPMVSTATGTLLLGALPPGNYQFNVVNDGQVERLIPFSVAPDGSPSLTGTARLPDGQFRFQVQGLAPFRYTVEESLNLKEWIPVSANPGPFLFTDPDARFEEQRFFRVRVE